MGTTTFFQVAVRHAILLQIQLPIKFPSAAFLFTSVTDEWEKNATADD